MKKYIINSAKFGIDVTRKYITSKPRAKSIADRAIRYIERTRVKKDPYAIWLETNFPDFIDINKIKIDSDSLSYRPLITVVVPVYNTRNKFLRECIVSVLAQVYDNWELIIVDDASTSNEVRKIINEYSNLDKRIRAIFLDTNLHIAGATNKGFSMAKGEFIGLLDHDDILWPNTLYEVVKALNRNKKIDFLYTDEDKIGVNRYDHFSPFFKPDWNPDFLHSVNYITHFSVIRKTLLDKVGGERGEYNGAQDWDLFLRVTRVTKNIYHIPKILYSWRVHDESTSKSTKAKPYVVEAQRRAISDDLLSKGMSNTCVMQDPINKGYWMVEYEPTDNPLVSIVIPSKDQYKIVKRCVDSIYERSSYKNFEIVLVDTGSKDFNVINWYKSMERKHANFRRIDWHEKSFSYARSCNEGARKSKGDVLIMLNNDTEIITSDWIEKLAGDALRKEIGAVGCLLFYPDKYHIQHAGIGVGLGGVAANSFSMMTLKEPMSQTQHLMINTKHNMTAVTAACMAVRKSVYDEIGGFDEDFRVTYNDVDLCLRLHEKGYKNLYTPHVRLIHHESISIGHLSDTNKRDTEEFNKSKALFIKRWLKYIKHDPNLNPNLSKNNAYYELPAGSIDSE